MSRQPDISALADELLTSLKQQTRPESIDGMARYGISRRGTLGVSMPAVRRLARQACADLGRNQSDRHKLARLLWTSGIHEARIMAVLVDAPPLVSETQMETWAADLDSWDVCDQLCINLFRKTPLAWIKAAEWPDRPEEFIKRAGFALGATLAVHEKSADDARFIPLLECSLRQATDERPMVKKAVSWQIRQIGKRSIRLNTEAIAIGERILQTYPRSKAARWIAHDVVRELQSSAVQDRLKRT